METKRYNLAETVEAWRVFQTSSGGVKPPQSEADYERLLAFLSDLTDNYNCNQEPYGSLFDLIAGYVHEWEVANEPEYERLRAELQKGIDDLDAGRVSKLSKDDIGRIARERAEKNV